MAEFPDTMFEEREEMLISPTGDSTPTLRTAHFIKPTIYATANLHHQSVQKVAPFALPSKPSSRHASYNIPNLRKNLNFLPSQYIGRPWKSWVDRLRSKHESTWKKAGIFEAIALSLTYEIPRELNDVVFAAVEKWCPETNTFMFPWGEATISLEDMIVFGGFSVLGDSVVLNLSSADDDMKEAERDLRKAWEDIKSSTGQKPRVKLWKDYLDENPGSKIEHEIFLYCWLSRYVFPCRDGMGCKRRFPLAVHLARGTRVALAPAVLACIYRNLSALKSRMLRGDKDDDDDDETMLTLFAPFHLIRLWIWKRFPTFRQSMKPLTRCGGDTLGISRWNGVKNRQVENLKMELDSAGENFQWRPYAPLNVYTSRERLVLVDSCLAEEIQSFVRCIRVSELIGLGGIIEQYLPHRFAMQFGFDQDVPGNVARLNKTVKMAWKNYTRPIDDVQLYVPPRLFESDVTTRYLQWRKQLLFDEQDAMLFLFKGVNRKKRSSRHAVSPKRLKSNTWPYPVLGFYLSRKTDPPVHIKDILSSPPAAPGIPSPVVPGNQKTGSSAHIKDILSPPPAAPGLPSPVVPGNQKTDSSACFKDVIPPPPAAPGIPSPVVPGNKKIGSSARFKVDPQPAASAANFKRVELVPHIFQNNERRLSPYISSNAQRLKITTTTRQRRRLQSSPRALIHTAQPEHEQVDDTDMYASNNHSRPSLHDGSTDVVDNGRVSSTGDGVSTSNHNGARCRLHEVQVLELESRVSMLEQELATLRSVIT